MPKPIVAETAGTCGRCGRGYTAGTHVTYSRIPGNPARFHYPNCFAALPGAPAVPSRIPSPRPASRPSPVTTMRSSGLNLSKIPTELLPTLGIDDATLAAELMRRATGHATTEETDEPEPEETEAPPVVHGSRTVAGVTVRSTNAKWPAKCSACSGAIVAGDAITYTKDRKPRILTHAGCWNDSLLGAPSASPATKRIHIGDGAVATVPTSPVLRAPAKTKPTSPRLRVASAWYTVLPALMAAGATRLLVVGPPGTGKSTIAAEGYLYRVTCHEEGGPESLIGMFIQRDGETVWVDGPATLAMREGTRLILDEIDHTSSENMSLMYALLDDAPQIMLPTGEIVQAAEGYNVIANMNGNPNDLPEAILDRMEAVLLADVPHADALATFDGLAASPALAEKLKAATLNYYRNALTREPWDWNGKPTLRRMRNFARFVSAGIEPGLAAKCVFGNSAKEIESCLTTAAL